MSRPLNMYVGIRQRGLRPGLGMPPSLARDERGRVGEGESYAYDDPALLSPALL